MPSAVVCAVPSPAAAKTVSSSAARRQRRSRRRMPHRMPCVARIFNGATGFVTEAAGQTVNLSVGGVALQLSEPVREGTWIEVLVSRPVEQPIRIAGTVAHCRRLLLGAFEIGVEIAQHA